MIGNSPEFEDGTSDQFFRGLRDTGVLDISRVRTRIWRRMVMFCPRDVDVVSAVRMVSPAKIHV
jgi:hypothetical protein